MVSELKKKLMGGSFGSLSVRSANVVLSFLVSVVLARQLGVDQYGIFSLVVSIILLLSIPVTLGLPELLSRNIAVYNAQQNWPLMKGLLRWTNLCVLYFSAVIIGIAIAVAMLLHERISNDFFYLFLLALPLLPLQGLNNLRASALRGLHRFTAAQTPENLIQPLAFLTLFSMVILVSNAVTADIAMLVRIIAVVTGFAFGLAVLLKVKPKQLVASAADYDKSSWQSSSYSFLLLGAMLTINTQVDTLLVGVLLSNADVGVYRVVATGATLVAFIYASVNPVIGPLVAELHAKEEKARLARMITKASWLVFLSSLPISIFFVFFGRELLQFVYGEGYATGATALAILAVGQLAITMLGAGAVVLNMTGNEKYNARLCVVATGVNVLLNFLFIPYWGVNGAALATAISLVGWRAAAAIIVYFKLNMNTTIFCRA
jgi:O-antigen/teichoic acid export membrane protein